MTPLRGRPIRFIALAVVLAMVGGAVTASADGEIVVSVNSVDDSRFPEVSAVFTADEAGRPVTDLSTNEVTVAENGVASSVSSIRVASDAAIPLALLVTFDSSGSMAGANLAQAKAAASALFKNLAPGDRGALITFSDDVRISVPLGGAQDELQAAVAALQATGNTALYDAVAQSGRVAAASGAPRRAVVLISDGEDFGGRSGITRAQSLQAAADGQALFYVIGIGQQVDAAYLQELARQSGGRYFAAAGASDVAGIYASIATLLRSQYVVTFRSAAPPEARSRTVTLTVQRAASTGQSSLAYQSNRPVPAPETPTSEPEATPVAQTQPPAAQPKSEGSPKLLTVVLIVAALVVVGVGILFWRRRRRPAVSAGPSERRELPRPDPLPSTSIHGTLTATRGSDLVAVMPIDGRPVTLGGSRNCDLYLEDPATRQTEIRLWWRDGALMAHLLTGGSNGSSPLLNGAPFRWASVSEGDELRVGPFLIRYAGESAGALP